MVGQLLKRVINTEVENSCEASQRVAVWIKLTRLQTDEPEAHPKTGLRARYGPSIISSDSCISCLRTGASPPNRAQRKLSVPAPVKRLINESLR